MLCASLYTAALTPPAHLHFGPSSWLTVVYILACWDGFGSLGGGGGDTERRLPCEDNTLDEHSSIRRAYRRSSCGDSCRHEFSSVVSYGPPLAKMPRVAGLPSKAASVMSCHPSKPECILTARCLGRNAN